MKKYFAIMLVMVLALSLLTACGEKDNNSGGNSTPGTSQTDEYAKEFTISVGASDKWTAFPGESDVKYQVSDDYVLSISHDGKEVEFTGKQLGESTVFAFSGDKQLKALVKVVAANGNDTSEPGAAGKGLYIENRREGGSITCYITTEKVTGETQAKTIISEKRYVGITEAVSGEANVDDSVLFPWVTAPPVGDAYTIIAVFTGQNSAGTITEYYAASGSMGQGLNVDNGENKPWGLFVELYPGT